MTSEPRILKRTRQWIAVHKPSGWTVYSESPDAQSCQVWLERKLRCSVHPVHRLDKETCGVLLFGLSSEVASLLTRSFRGGLVEKKYRAVALGETPIKGKIDVKLDGRKDSGRKGRNGDSKARVNAETLYRREAFSDGLSLLEVRPLTGRFHQIRKHLKAIDHPILGDEKYGAKSANEKYRRKFGINRVLLSAVSIRIPAQGRLPEIKVATKPDSDFEKFVRKFFYKEGASAAATPSSIPS